VKDVVYLGVEIRKVCRARRRCYFMNQMANMQELTGRCEGFG